MLLLPDWGAALHSETSHNPLIGNYLVRKWAVADWLFERSWNVLPLLPSWGNGNSTGCQEALEYNAATAPLSFPDPFLGLFYGEPRRGGEGGLHFPGIYALCV